MVKKTNLRYNDEEIDEYKDKLKKGFKTIVPSRTGKGKSLSDDQIDFLIGSKNMKTEDSNITSEIDLLKLGFLVKDVFEAVYVDERRVDRSLGEFKVVGYPIENQKLVRIDVYRA